METITIVGAGVARADRGDHVRRGRRAGRARTTHTVSPAAAPAAWTAPYRANLGPHVLYSDGDVVGVADRAGPAPAGRRASRYAGACRIRRGGALHRTPPLALIPAMLKLRGRRRARTTSRFRAWASSHLAGERTAEWLSRGSSGVYTFHHDPGELSAAFIWSAPAGGDARRRPVRFLVGGLERAGAGARRTGARRLGRGVPVARGQPVTTRRGRTPTGARPRGTARERQARAEARAPIEARARVETRAASNPRPRNPRPHRSPRPRNPRPRRIPIGEPRSAAKPEPVAAQPPASGAPPGPAAERPR